MRVLLANPRGFCAGVRRALSIVDNALELYGSPIYVLHEIVHNDYIIDNLCKRGIIFTNKVSNIPNGAVVIISAHGVSKTVYQEIKERRLTLLDATCPLVSKIHNKVSYISSKKVNIVLIGKSSHVEIKGTIGHFHGETDKLHLVESLEDIKKISISNKSRIYVVTQSTLLISDLSKFIEKLSTRFSNIVGPKNDICYATVNRQMSTLHLTKQADIVIIVGSVSSSNSNSLFELVQYNGKIAKLVNSASEIKEEWFKDVNTVGITSGASTPEILVQEILNFLRTLGSQSIIELIGPRETVFFK